VFAATKTVLVEAWRAFASQGGRLLAAAIAFNALLSLLPLFILMVSFAALFTDEAVARAALLENLNVWIGPSGVSTVSDLLARAGGSDRTSTLIGGAALVWGATRLFATVRRSLDMLWGHAPSLDDTVKERAEKFLEHRLRGLALVVGLGFLLAMLVFLQTGVSMAQETTNSRVLGKIGQISLSFGATAAIFSVIYRVLPTKAVPFYDATVGGALTAVLFTLGANIAGALVGHYATTSTFGAASSIVVLLLWVNYSAHAFLFGAAITAARAKRRGVL
jgi:membrane protein